MIKNLSLLLSVTLLISHSAIASEKNRSPVGEVAKYDLDSSSARTSWGINGGKFTAKVRSYNADAAAYNTRLKFDIDTLLGKKKGLKDIDVPEQYFTAEFLEELRQKKRMEFPQFKVRHLGFKNVRNKDGKRYRHCDQILIFNIDTSQAVAYRDMNLSERSLTALVGQSEDLAADTAALFKKRNERASATAANIKNLKVKVHVKEGVPVLGAVKVDISGSANGTRFKAGFDYISR